MAKRWISDDLPPERAALARSEGAANVAFVGKKLMEELHELEAESWFPRLRRCAESYVRSANEGGGLGRQSAESLIVPFVEELDELKDRLRAFYKALVVYEREMAKHLPKREDAA